MNIYFLSINYYSTGLISKLLASINNDYISELDYHFTIVNNSLDDPDIHRLKQDNITLIHSQTNLGFGNACNLGLEYIYEIDSSAIVWIINPDTYFEELNLEKLVSFFQKYPKISILGTLIYTPEAKLWFGGGKFIPQSGAIVEQNLFADHPDLDHIECDWVSGCSLIINLKKFKQCPQFNPNYFLYYEDFDFCQRYASQGHQIAITNQLILIHKPSSITNQNLRTKLKHSTYSYLITIFNYSPVTTFLWRFLRLVIMIILLLGIQPSATIGKIQGLYDFLINKKRIK